MNNIIFKTILLKGETGRGIVSIEKTGTLGRIDTYTIYYTDGTTSTFEVENGSSQQAAVDTVNGMTGNVVLTYSDVNALPDTTKLKDLEDDTTHRTVTDAEKTTWSGKVDSVNGYTGVIALTYSDVGALPSTTTLADLPTDATHRTVSDTEKNAWNAKTTTNYTPTITDGVELGVIAENGVNKSIKAPNYSNPNLLDNAWFTVNQKGFSSKTSSSSESNDKFMDRWKANWFAGYPTQIILNSDDTLSLKINKNSTYGTTAREIRILQEIEDYEKLIGKQCTLSIMLSDGTIYSTTKIVPSTGQAESTITFATGKKITFAFDNRNSGMYKNAIWFRFQITSDIYISSDVYEELKIKAIKLEIGSQSTLALDVAPSYTTELLKCQRYYRKLNLSNCIGMTHKSLSVSDTHYVNSIWDIPMRAIPTVSYTSGSVDGVLFIVGEPTRTIITKSIVDIASDINGNLMITTDTSDTTNIFTPLNPVFVNATGIEFNAEL